MNDRLIEIDKMINKIKPNDTIKNLLIEYKQELENYIYIESIELFSVWHRRSDSNGKLGSSDHYFL